jgi:hypothetical protein
MAVLLLIALLAACDGTPKRPDDPGRSSEKDRTEKPEKVVVPRACVDRMNEYVARKMMVLADEIAIDASSDPFFGAIVVTADPRVVERTEAVDAESKTTVIRLRNRTPGSLMERDLPQIRVGDGLGVIATREILIRFHNRVLPGRPMYFDLLARGNVVFEDPTYAVTRRTNHLSMRLAVKKVEDGYVFEGKVE